MPGCAATYSILFHSSADVQGTLKYQKRWHPDALIATLDSILWRQKLWSIREIIGTGPYAPEKKSQAEDCVPQKNPQQSLPSSFWQMAAGTDNAEPLYS